MQPIEPPGHTAVEPAKRLARALHIATLTVAVTGFQLGAVAAGVERLDGPGASTFALGEMRSQSPLTLTRLPETRRVAAVQACAARGPFLDPAHAEEVAHALARHGSEARLRETVVRERNGFIVLARAPAGDPAPLVEALRAGGVSDFLVIGHGEFEGHVSLGVYNGPLSSEQRRAALAALGFETEIRARTRSRAAWMVEADVDASPSSDRCRPVRAASRAVSPSAS